MIKPLSIKEMVLFEKVCLSVKRIKGSKKIGKVLDNSKLAAEKLEVFINPNNPTINVEEVKRSNVRFSLLKKTSFLKKLINQKMTIKINGMVVSSGFIPSVSVARKSK
ncbi:MAG: hypothetical protein ACOYOV_07265 [Bacteroidales bacterium]